MESGFAHNWWAVALRGVLAILFGVLAFVFPGALWLVIVCLFAASALVDGAFAIGLALTAHGRAGPWWALLLRGVVGIAAGLVGILWTNIAELALLLVVASWSLVGGAFEIAGALQLPRYRSGKWLLALSGALSIVLGVALALMPLAGMIVIAWWIAAYAVALGVLLLVVAFQLRSLASHARRGEPVAVP